MPTAEECGECLKIFMEIFLNTQWKTKRVYVDVEEHNGEMLLE